MHTTTIRRPITTIPTVPRPAKPDHEAVFLEPVYADGRTWHDPNGDSEDDDQDDHNSAI
ncbi:MAG TPA: hypothetical protein VFY14_13560 [Streptomyces sp.]|nr:hypothetical protein [Streptomyces sp.]